MSTPIERYHRSSPAPSFFIQDLGTAAFFGLEFIDTAEDLVFPDQNLSTRPSILIEGSKMVIDYSDSGVAKDRDFIQTQFSSMTGGNGFTLTNAIYSDVVNSYEADLAASCTLNSYTDFKILATYSTIGSTTETNYYHSEYFETIPQISSAIGLTSGVTLNQLINYPTGNDTSFVSSNISVGDYLDISTSSNDGRFTIMGVTVDNFSREIITLKSDIIISTEDLKGTEVVVGHKRKVYLDTENPYNLNQTIVHYVSDAVSDTGVAQFVVDGTIQRDLVLFRGNQYIFIENSYSTYPMSFSITPDGSNSGGSAYADIGFYTMFDSSLGKRMAIVVPNNNTPNQLYYFCQNSSGMGGGVRVVGNYTHTNSPATISTNVNRATTNSATVSSRIVY